MATYEKCSNSQHNPKTAHSEESCWQLHPTKNPHNNSRTTAHTALITGRALCAKAYLGKRTDKLILDSGSSHHMFKDRKDFINHKAEKTKIEVANSDSMIGEGVGLVCGSHLGSPLSLSNSLLGPELKCNLVSLVQLAKKGCSLTFKDDNCFEVTQNNKVALTGQIVDGLMKLNLDLGKSPVLVPRSLAAVADGSLLHSRLGHPGQLPFYKVFPNHAPPSTCEPCILSKQNRLPY